MEPSLSITWLTHQLTTSRLFEPGPLSVCVSEYRASNRSGDGHGLAQFLVQIGLLTPYQAERVLAGEANKLVLGAYLLAEPLGSGTVGTVFRAVGRADRQMYAVKVLPLRSLWNVQAAKKQRQAFIGLPEHPVIVPFLDIDSAAGHHYLVWPYVECRSLEQTIHDGAEFGLPEIVRVLTQVANGLATCHAAGIVHGLLNPLNIALGSADRVWLLDLGTGAILTENLAEDESLFDTISTANAAMRLVDYAAPETFESTAPRTPAADVYSLGCVAYWLLTGTTVCGDGNAVARVIAHQTMHPTPAHVLNPAVPTWLSQLVSALLAKDPTDRPSSQHVFERLRTGLAEGIASSVVVSPRPAPVVHQRPEEQFAASVPKLLPPQASARFGGPLSMSEIDFSQLPSDEQPTHDNRPSRSADRVSTTTTPTVVESADTPPLRIRFHDLVSKVTSAPAAVPAVVEVARQKSPPSPWEKTATSGSASVAQVAIRPVFSVSWWQRLASRLCFWRPVRDLVQVSVYGPPAVVAGQGLSLQAYAHQPEFAGSVRTLARAAHNDAELLCTGFLDQLVERGTNLGLRLKVGNAGVAQALQTLAWAGQTQSRAFDVHVPWESPNGWTPAGLAVAVNTEMAVYINFQLLIRPRKA